MDDIRTLVKELIEKVKEESKKHNMGAVSYPWVAGYLEGLLSGIPITKENIKYLKDELRSIPS